MKLRIVVLLVVLCGMVNVSYGYNYRNEMTEWSWFVNGNLTGSAVFDGLDFPPAGSNYFLENYGWLGTQATGTTPKPMSEHRELIQLCMRSKESLHHANWSHPLTLGDSYDDALGVLKWVAWGEATTGDYLQIVEFDPSGGYQGTYVTGAEFDDFDMTEWHVFAIRPNGYSADFYIKDGNEPFDPDNLPAPITTVTTNWNTDSLNLYNYLGNEYQYIYGGTGQGFLVDWIQVGKDRPIDDCDDVWAYGYGLIADINKNCRIDLADFAKLAQDWLLCNDPTDPSCIMTW